MAKKLDENGLWEFADPRRLPPGEPVPDDSSLGPEMIEMARMERIKKLAADPNYPNEEIITALAEMLARHWYS